MSTCRELPWKVKKEATTISARKTILNAGKSNDENRDLQGAVENQLEPGPAPENDDDRVAITLQELITDQVRSQIANTLATILDMGKEAVDQLLHAATLSAQGRI